jgi:acyl-CoA synthetase (AMP-forming)/AMP-acid ligase II
MCIVHGLVAGLLAPLLSGSSVVIPTKFSAGSFWKDFVSESCTWYTAGRSQRYEWIPVSEAELRRSSANDSLDLAVFAPS